VKVLGLDAPRWSHQCLRAKTRDPPKPRGAIGKHIEAGRASDRNGAASGDINPPSCAIEVFELSPSGAAGHIQQPVPSGTGSESEARAHRSEIAKPGFLCQGTNPGRVVERGISVGVRIGPVAISLDTPDPLALLPVAAN